MDFYNSSFTCSVVRESTQHISIFVQHGQFSIPFLLCAVHAKCTVEERVELWDTLLFDRPSSGAWVVYGDFNVIVDAQEKR